MISASALRPSASPSRRCSGSSSRPRPTVRTRLPSPLASSVQPPRTALANAPDLRRLAGRAEPARGLAAPRGFRAELLLPLLRLVAFLLVVADPLAMLSTVA